MNPRMTTYTADIHSSDFGWSGSHENCRSDLCSIGAALRSERVAAHARKVESCSHAACLYQGTASDVYEHRVRVH